MKIVKTIKLKILSHRKIFDETIEIYNKALSFFVDIVNRNWDTLESKTDKERLRYIEILTHKTADNPNPKYDFDSKFYKFPSYLRRACIMESIGIVSSHQSRYKNWLSERENKLRKGKKFFKKPPTLQTDHHSFPVFYKDNMFKRLSDNQAMIKIYKNNDWVWITITFDDRNLKNRDLEIYKELNPTLIKNGRKYFLHIPYQKEIRLSEKKVNDRIVVSVDLGLTNTAVCSALKSDGTVIGRLFINQPIEKDHLRKELNKLAKANRQSGTCSKPNIWRRINGLQKQITQNTANSIVEFALKHNADVIVFECLSRIKIPKGFYGVKRLRYKLQYWAKQRIQILTEQKAHSKGIRIARVLARGTSKFAFDSSGEVERNGKKDICKFPNGKVYHCDLSASYNIGSRYFVKELIKPLSEMARLELQAKVPDALNRSGCILSSLISLHRLLGKYPDDTDVVPYSR